MKYKDGDRNDAGSVLFSRSGAVDAEIANEDFCFVFLHALCASA
jgi:hypothetical protein